MRMTGRHIHLDCLGGIAGDMFAAAMTGLFPKLEAPILEAVRRVLPAEAGTARFCEVTKDGFAARRFGLDSPERPPALHHDTRHADLAARIDRAGLDPRAAHHARAILLRLARAEAAIHGTPVEAVHFHEVGDWDSLMDTVAAGVIAAALDGATISVSSLPLGGGTIRATHGRLPVPAPATAALLTGYDWHDDGAPGERVTPTGAAILAHLTGGAGNGHHPGGRLTATGLGAGTRRIEGVANLLRAMAFEAPDSAGAPALLLACDIDDMTGEEIAHAAERLRALDGLHDLSLLTLLGKKGRPATRFEAIVDPAAADRVAAAFFVQTSTLGLRRTAIRRDLLARSEDRAASGLRRKTARRADGATIKVEADDLVRFPSLAARRRAAREGET